MAETGDLIIKIGGDASKFKATIADVENSLKSFKANLGTTGLNIKIEALGFQETKSNIKGVADFAEGTLGAIKNTIKDVKAERLTISADPNSLAPFNIKLNELNTTVKELEKAGILKNVPQEAAVAANSLQGLNNKLNELRKQRAIIDPDTNARAILQINQQIDKLQQKIVNLNNLGQKIDTGGGLSNGLNSIKKGSVEAGRAITSLALVAQDLPFGFIGIQNNLPAVQKSFESLNKAADSSKGAFKAFASALAGPAGFFLAFSALTGAVTFAVQKYGSLGNAIDALFGRLSPLNDLTQRTAKSLAEYNQNLVTNEEALGQASGSMQGQILKAKTLAGIILNLSESEDARKRALSQLKELDADRFEAFDIEKGKLEGLKTAVDNYTSSILANAVAQKFTERVSSAAEQLENQRNLYAQIINKIDELKAKGVDKQAQNLKSLNAEAAKFGAEPIAPSDDIRLFEDLNIQLNQQEVILKNVASAYENASSTARGYIDAAARLSTIKTPEGKKPGTGGTGTKSVFSPKIDSQALDEFTNIDKIIARVTKYGDAFINVNNSVAERTDALKKLLEVDPKYFESFRVGSKDVDTAREAIEQLLRTLESNKLFEKQREEGAKLNQIWAKQAEDRAEAITKAEDAAVEKMFRNDTYNLKLKLNFTGFDADLEKAVGTINSSFKSLQDVYDSVFKDVIEKNKQIASSIEGYLSQPMTTFFDILTKDGETSWKDFGKVVIDTLKRIATQAITTAIAKTLANILAPGFGSISSGGLEAGFEYLYGESIRGGGGQANFGGIRGNQGVNMNGQVVMTLRGADLVGAMNRTNTTISRVG